MKKIFGLIFATIFILSACNEKKDEKITNNKPTIKIGVSLPLVGGLSFAGTPAKEAVLMTFDKWKEKDTKFNYELIIEDDSFEPKKIAMAGNKLLNMDKVDAVISMFDLPAYYYFEQANKRNFIHLTCSWGDDLSDTRYNFNNITSHAEQARTLVTYMKKQGVKNIGYVSQNNKGPQHLKENIKNELIKAGINLVFEEDFNIGNKDYRMFLASIKNEPVDLIMTVLLPPDMYSFSKQKFEMGIKTPLTTVDYFQDMEDKSIFEGYYFSLSSMGTDKFKADLYQKSAMSVRACVANTADNLDLLIWAYENAQSFDDKIPTSDEISAKLHGIKNWSGAIGILNVLDSGLIESKAYMKQIKDGKIIAIP